MTEPKYVRSTEALHSEVGEDVVALHIRNGHCFGMEKVTADVWRMLDEPVSLEGICGSLVERYEVELDVCRSEVSRILETMANEGLVEVVS